jgi:hypothetical protein
MIRPDPRRPDPKAQPSMRYLGVPPGAPPRRLLELPEGEVSAADVLAALERQKRRIQRHPAGREPSAEKLIRELELAARWFLDAMPAEAAAVSSVAGGAPPIPPAAVRKALGVKVPIRGDERTAKQPRKPGPDEPSIADLTEFDREILGTLVAGRGFNRESRARLLAVASRHGVSSAGLGKVVQGLARAMRTGAVVPQARARSAIADAPMWRPAEPSRLTVAFEQLDEALSREVRGDTPGRLIRLLVVFVGLAMGILYFLSWVLTRAPVVQPPQQTPPAVAAAEAARRVDPPIAPAVEVDRPGTVRPARWPKPPLMRGPAPGPETAAALREALVAPEALRGVGRRLQLEANRPSAAVVRDWLAIQENLGAAWPLLDATTRAAAIEAGVAAMRLIENDDVARQFLDAWPVDYVQADQPGGVWRGAWSAGMLAEIASRPGAPAASAVPAIDRLDKVVSRRAILRSKGVTVFENAAGSWLDGAVKTLVTSTAADDKAPVRWERWHEAQRAVRNRGALLAAMVEAIGGVLASGVNIAEPGRSADLLGRLVGEIDWTERSPDQTRLREAMTLWFDDASVGASRLWVLTSLLDLSYDTAWYLPEFVLSPDAGREERSAMLERILAAWPQPSGQTQGGGVLVDSALLEQWRTTFAAAERAPLGSDVERLRAAVVFARLNGAAQAFVSGDDDAAASLLDEARVELASTENLAGVSAPPGRPSGSDGEFTAAYEAAGRDPTKRQDELRGLRARPAAGDLGIRDAETLVTEALRASPSDVRQLAQTVLAERFASGPTVLLELLDQLPTAPENAALSQMLEAILGDRLPEPRSPDWMRAARLGLVRKLLAMEPSEGHAVDALSERYGVALEERSRLFRIGWETPERSLAPEETMERLVAQWRIKCGAIFFSEPFPAPLDELDRRRGVRSRLADGGVQRCVALQASLLEFMAATIVAERPALKDAVTELLADAVARRARAGHVLDQLVEGERSMALVQQLQFESAGGAPVRPAPGDGTPPDAPTDPPAGLQQSGGAS